MISRDIHEALRLLEVRWSVQDELARFDESCRQAAEPIGTRIAKIETDLRDAMSIPDLGRQSIAPLSHMHLPDLSRVSTPLRDFSSVLNAASPTLFHPQVSDQWKPALMRWSQPPVAEILSTHLSDLARVVSEAAHPEIAATVARATQDLSRFPTVDMSSLLAGLDIAHVSVPEFPVFDGPLIEIPLWPEAPEVESEPREEKMVPEPGDAPSGIDAATKSELEVLKRKIETLERRVVRGQPSPAREFVIRIGPTIVGGLIVKYVWECTPAPGYIDLVIKGIVVCIEGAHYTLPYVP